MYLTLNGLFDSVDNGALVHPQDKSARALAKASSDFSAEGYYGA